MYGGGVKQYYDGEYVNEGMDYPRKVKDVADRAKGYDIPGFVVDGNDVEAVYSAVKKAADRARAGKGPTLIECKTYRWRTHFEGEPDTYRTPEEVQAWKDRCPVTCYADKLKAEGVLTDGDLERIAREVEDEMNAAIRFAEESPFPRAEEALEDVYA
jgi:pyruvate dehydrogenase E1 component alpha subunit